jgi:predicted RNase H-like nuclease (RuvC/YqgF family)
MKGGEFHFNNGDYHDNVQNTELENHPAQIEEEDKEHFQTTIAMLKDLIMKKDEEIQQLQKELAIFKNFDNALNNELDLRSKDNSMNFTGDDTNLKEKLEKCKKRLKQYKQESDSSMQQVFSLPNKRIS